MPSLKYLLNSAFLSRTMTEVDPEDVCGFSREFTAEEAKHLRKMTERQDGKALVEYETK